MEPEEPATGAISPLSKGVFLRKPFARSRVATLIEVGVAWLQLVGYTEERTQSTLLDLYLVAVRCLPYLPESVAKKPYSEVRTILS